MAVPMPHHRFTVDEYEEMARVGILTEDDRVELIHGEIVAMSPIGARHVYSVAALDQFLMRQAPERMLNLVQSPLRLPDKSEAQPDVRLLRPGDYRRTLPNASDVLIVMEVSDTTREYDRGTKFRSARQRASPKHGSLTSSRGMSSGTPSRGRMAITW